MIALLGAIAAPTGSRRAGPRRRAPLHRRPARPDRPAAAVIGTGTKDLPGFPSAQELATGKLKGNQLAVRASGWSTKLGQIQGRVESITVGEAPADAGADGEPANAVGGRVPMLTSIRDSYAAAIEMYFEAANTYQKAGEASGKTALTVRGGDGHRHHRPASPWTPPPAPWPASTPATAST